MILCYFHNVNRRRSEISTVPEARFPIGVGKGSFSSVGSSDDKVGTSSSLQKAHILEVSELMLRVGEISTQLCHRG